MNEKLQRICVRDEAYLRLRDWIVEGALKPGTKLRDKALAEQLGVSRTPIREALLRLEEEDLVKSKPNSATFVCPIDVHKAFDLYAIVWTLECLALTQSFPSITKAHIHAMAEANKRLIQGLKESDRLKAYKADNDFHEVFIQLSQNQELEKILVRTKLKLKRLELCYFESMKDAHESCEEHHQIIEALKQQDLSAALVALECNWKASLARLQKRGES